MKGFEWNILVSICSRLSLKYGAVDLKGFKEVSESPITNSKTLFIKEGVSIGSTIVILLDSFTCLFDPNKFKFKSSVSVINDAIYGMIIDPFNADTSLTELNNECLTNKGDNDFFKVFES